jgi:hypothetical protein
MRPTFETQYMPRYIATVFHGNDDSHVVPRLILCYPSYHPRLLRTLDVLSTQSRMSEWLCLAHKQPEAQSCRRRHKRNHSFEEYAHASLENAMAETARILRMLTSCLSIDIR